MCGLGTDAKTWDERYSGPDLQWGSGPNARFAEEVAGLKPGRAIDLAAGEGRNSIWLAEHGWDVTAVDFSRVAMARAADLAAARSTSITTITASLDEFPPDPGAFDLVAIIYLQVPNPPFGDIVARAACAVAPGGTFLLINHHVDNLEHGYGGPRDPSVLTRTDDVVSQLGDLQVESADRIERIVATDDGPRTALDLLVRARRATR